MCKVNIMGTLYEYREDDLNNEELAQNDGICKLYDKEIIVRSIGYMAGETVPGKSERYDHVIRHELIHAIAHECGVQYGEDEALVDWIAHIIPIVEKAFKEVKVIGG